MSVEPLCQVETCGRPVKDATVCGSCTDDLAKALGDVSALADELEVTLTRQARLGGGDGGRKNAETPLVFHYAASETSYVLRNTLVGWVRELSTDGLGIACGDTVADMARWLLARVSTLAQHAAGGEAVEEICSAVRDVERVIDRSPERWYAGPCDCGMHLYVRPGVQTFTCRDCGERYDVAQRREWLLDAAEDTLGHAALVSQALTALAHPVTPERIRKWAERGQIVAHSVDAHGRALYQVGEVIELLTRAARYERMAS